MQRTANPCTSVQFRYRPPKFDIYRVLFRLSSAVEQSAVNRLVACSNQAAGANKRNVTFMVAFFLLSTLKRYIIKWKPTNISSKFLIFVVLNCQLSFELQQFVFQVLQFVKQFFLVLLLVESVFHNLRTAEH